MTTTSLYVPFNLKPSILGSGTLAVNFFALLLITSYALVMSSH